MTIDDYIHPCIVQDALHGQPHALVLLVVRHICSTCPSALSDSKQRNTAHAQCVWAFTAESVLKMQGLVAVLDVVSEQKVTATRLVRHQLVCGCNSAAGVLWGSWCCPNQTQT